MAENGVGISVGATLNSLLLGAGAYESFTQGDVIRGLELSAAALALLGFGLDAGLRAERTSQPTEVTPPAQDPEQPAITVASQPEITIASPPPSQMSECLIRRDLDSLQPGNYICPAQTWAGARTEACGHAATISLIPGLGKILEEDPSSNLCAEDLGIAVNPGKGH